MREEYLTSLHKHRKSRRVRESGRVAVKALLLLLLFVVIFGISLVFFFKLPFLLESGRPGPTTVTTGSSAEDGVATEVDELFPAAVHIRTAGDYVVVPQSEQLDTKEGEDFFVFSWVKLRRLPKPDEKVMYFAKTQVEGGRTFGYAVGLVRTGEVYRPIVHWEDDQGHGGSYLFTELLFAPKHWLLLAFGVVDNKVLTLSSAMPSPQTKEMAITFHGSHELEIPVVAVSPANILLGSTRAGNFRGFIGPFGVFRGEKLAEHFKEIVEELTDEPFQLPSDVEKGEVKLFVAEGITDQSPNHFELKARGIGEFSSKSRKERKKP